MDYLSIIVPKLINLLLLLLLGVFAVKIHVLTGEQFEDTLGSTDENHSSDFILQSAPAAEGYLL